MSLEQATTSSAVPPANVFPTGGRSLLVVDRDESISQSISKAFAGANVRVVHASTGMQGYWLAISERPDLIVTELGMPNGSGGEMLQCLKSDAHTKDIPVVVLTGQTYPGMRAHLERVGASAVLAKPLQADQLVHLVRQLLADAST